jgi:hypothetical protein
MANYTGDVTVFICTKIYDFRPTNKKKLQHFIAGTAELA